VRHAYSGHNAAAWTIRLAHLLSDRQNEVGFEEVDLLRSLVEALDDVMEKNQEDAGDLEGWLKALLGGDVAVAMFGAIAVLPALGIGAVALYVHHVARYERRRAEQGRKAAKSLLDTFGPAPGLRAIMSRSEET